MNEDDRRDDGREDGYEQTAVASLGSDATETLATPKEGAATEEGAPVSASLRGGESKGAERPDAAGYPSYRVEPGSRIRLKDVDPDESEHYRGKGDAKKELKRLRKRLGDLQERLYADNQQSLLIVLQAMDTGGKDGTIRGVFRGVNPQGCQVWPFKVPSDEEAEHDFLWRHHIKAPARGMITIFNRSHYENVLVVRVDKLAPKEVWERRYAMINDFEHMLALNNTKVLKFYLHISKDEQKRRLESRLQDPTKHWKFSENDIKERAHWDAYQEAYEDAINNCSTEFAPWYVVPANKEWYRNLVIARTIADTLEAMDPRYPPGAKGLEKLVIND
jgi:PPK2 family polyphosphate:nucleotide phosphotransferase